MDIPSPAKEDIPSYGGGVRGPAGVEMRDDPDEQEQIRRLRERGSHQSAPVTPPKAAAWKKAGRNKASRAVVLEPENTPPRPPSGPRTEVRAAGVEYDAGAASSGNARQEADPPGQPIPFNSSQFYRWGTWVCYFCAGVNPPKTTAFTSRLAARTRAPGVVAKGRPAPGALMIISCPGALPRSGATPGRLPASRSTRMILRLTSAARTIASRRFSPRECARSPSGKRRRQSGSGPGRPGRYPSLASRRRVALPRMQRMELVVP